MADWDLPDELKDPRYISAKVVKGKCDNCGRKIPDSYKKCPGCKHWFRGRQS